MSFAFIAWWYGVGLILSLVWPIHYRKKLSKRDWIGVFLRLPLYGLMGPLALVGTFPV